MNFTNIDDITDYINSFNLIFLTIISLLLLYKIIELSYLKKTNCYITQNLVEINNKLILLEKKLKEFDEQNNYKFSIISDASNLLDINSEIIKTDGYSTLYLDGKIPSLNGSEKVSSNKMIKNKFVYNIQRDDEYRKLQEEQKFISIRQIENVCEQLRQKVNRWLDANIILYNQKLKKKRVYYL